MGNIKNYDFSKLELKLSNSDYWDFYLSNDKSGMYTTGSTVQDGTCLVVWYDFNNLQTYEDNNSGSTTIYSLKTWDNAFNTGYTFNTIGLTGIDNGLITFDKSTGDTANTALLNAITGSSLFITSGDSRMIMNKVTGTTNEYIYPIDMVDDGFIYSKLCGGFYQGFYKIDGYSYEVLPTRVNQGWTAEFWLKPDDTCAYTAKTLNDDYPDNKGFFFYMGTRAENKYWNIWEGADSGCTSGCSIPTTACTDTISEWCTIPKENEISIIGDYGVMIPLDPPQIEIDLVTNEFLIYGRAREYSDPNITSVDEPNVLVDENGNLIVTEDNFDILLNPQSPFIIDGVAEGSTGTTNCSCGACSQCRRQKDNLGTQTVCSYDGKGIVVTKHSTHKTNFENPFLIYGRASNNRQCGCQCSGCTGSGLGNQTVCSFSGFTSETDELDYKVDIVDNAIGFRIKDDGSIGYRLLSVTGQCVTNSSGERTYVTGMTIEESYSLSGMVEDNAWSYIAIRFVTDYKTDCELETASPRKGKLMFYVNGKLKHTVDNFDEFIARRLNEYKDKQIGVPFNFSLGGGSQGLVESQTFGGLDPNDRGLPIETNFAGTFIGGIADFKFNICDIGYNNIVFNYNNSSEKYNPIPVNPSVLVDEGGNVIISENGTPILIP